MIKVTVAFSMQAFYMTENKQDASPFLLTNESQILEVTPFIIFFFLIWGLQTTAVPWISHVHL